MSLKRRVPKAQIGALPSPSWTYWLLIGDIPAGGIRLPGWVDEGLFWRPILNTPGPDDIWAVHGEALTAEAQAAGFAPWCLTGKKPRGAAVDAWAKAFCRQHEY